jgi:hypothetical protein
MSGLMSSGEPFSDEEIMLFKAAFVAVLRPDSIH